MTEHDREAWEQTHVNLWMHHNEQINSFMRYTYSALGKDKELAAHALYGVIRDGMFKSCAMDVSLFTTERIRIALDLLETDLG
jgi:hypothetical protein